MVDNEWNINFNKFELKMNPYVSVMCNTFHSYTTKDSIEVYEILGRSTTYLCYVIYSEMS